MEGFSNIDEKESRRRQYSFINEMLLSGYYATDREKNPFLSPLAGNGDGKLVKLQK